MASAAELSPDSLAARGDLHAPAARDRADQIHTPAGQPRRIRLQDGGQGRGLVVHRDPHRRPEAMHRDAKRHARVDDRVRRKLGREQLGIGDERVLMPPAPDGVGHQAARVGDRRDLSWKVRRYVENLARCRDDRGVQPAHIVQRIGVLIRRDGFAVIRAVQDERELAGKLVPQRLQVDRCKHVACVPEQRDHLPVRTDGAARAHGVANHAADHLEERVPNNPAVTHEPFEGRRSVEQEQRSLPIIIIKSIHPE